MHFYIWFPNLVCFYLHLHLHLTTKNHVGGFYSSFLIPNFAIFQTKTGTGTKLLGRLSVVWRTLLAQTARDVVLVLMKCSLLVLDQTTLIVQSDSKC